jgi:hypothetical protein
MLFGQLCEARMLERRGVRFYTFSILYATILIIDAGAGKSV